LRPVLTFWLIAAIGVFWGYPWASATPTDTQAWLLVASNIPLESTKQYQLYLEAQPRQGDDLQRASTVQLRTAVTYSFSKHWSSALGYAWTPFLLDTDYHRAYRDEHRTWQGITFSHAGLGAQWLHRLRQEQRFIENASDVVHRSRYQLRMNLPLSSRGDFGLSIFDEFMVHLTSVEQGPTSGYDRNRIFVGPFWQTNDVRYECGYLGEHAKRFGNDERWVNALLVSVVRSF
jgi:hypothetical protein